ncbi:MAG TPA: helix-turn-helix domain-containing protein [Luteimonas sp.]|jgi:AcrR family transcriptional regulator|nr:helix-turn-helix domain-containing protein [Luteimonas sp.]
MTEKRPYRMRRRAEAQDQTRRRILEAVMQLHEEVGPKATSISAIAERAGVQRLTVYRHFPDDDALIQACSGEWIQRNPPPDPGRWQALADPPKQVRTALAEFYRYYRRTARMWSAVHRDAADVPALGEPMGGYAAVLDAVAGELAGPFSGRRAKAQARATLRHALEFPTWDALERQGLGDAAKVALVDRWLQGIEAGA